jgi:hypothetical protein
MPIGPGQPGHGPTASRQTATEPATADSGCVPGANRLCQAASEAGSVPLRPNVLSELRIAVWEALPSLSVSSGNPSPGSVPSKDANKARNPPWADGSTGPPDCCAWDFPRADWVPCAP